jgi:ABC-type bacteriocin/lantibiotic exporter with double-glycine peptidase domain
MGEPTEEGDILKHTPADPERGVNLYALKTTSETLGYTTYLKRWTQEELKRYTTETSTPVLIHDQKENIGDHYSVLRAFKTTNQGEEIVILSDTEAGNIQYSQKDFQKIYKGNTLIILPRTEQKEEKTEKPSTEETKSETETTIHPLLSDPITDIPPEEAKEIWGKYVPVSFTMEQMGGEEAQIAEKLKQCKTNIQHPPQ